MIQGIYIAAGVIAFLWTFWALYVLVMGFYRAKLTGRLNGVRLWLAAPWVLLGIAVDIFAQYTVAAVFFLDAPKMGEHLVTDRLQRYIKEGSGWRYQKAKWICDHLLDEFDPHGDHC